MTGATHALMAEAIALQPLSADLRKSTVTFSWPTNKLIERGAYTVVTLRELQAALDTDARHGIGQIVPRPLEEGEHHWYRQSLNSNDYDVTEGGTEISVYLRRAPGETSSLSGTFPHWWGTVEIWDTQGRRWQTFIARMVVNDFGVLVSQETGLPV